MNVRMVAECTETEARDYLMSLVYTNTECLQDGYSQPSLPSYNHLYICCSTKRQALSFLSDVFLLMCNSYHMYICTVLTVLMCRCNYVCVYICFSFLVGIHCQQLMIIVASSEALVTILGNFLHF